MKQKICFVGLGMMGYPMAARLAEAGYPLFVHDANGEQVGKFCSTYHATPAPPTAAAFPEADVVITMLPNSDIVEAVLLGEQGLLRHLKPGATVIDMSSSEPMRSRALAEQLQKQGMRFLDAPVSGGVKRAVDGSLAIMVGGDAEVYAGCQPILQSMGKTLIHVGGPGAGHAMKALNNYVSAAGLVAAVEALQAGQKFGLDPAVMTDVFNNSTGRNNTTENKVKQYMLNGAYNSGFSLQLMVKDLTTAMHLGHELGLPMLLGDETLAIWRRAADAAGRPADHTEMYHLLDDNGKSREQNS